MPELICLSPDVPDSLRKIQTELRAIAYPGVRMISIETTASLTDTQITPFFLTRLDELMNSDKVDLVLLRGTDAMTKLLQERTMYPIVLLSVDPDDGEFQVTLDLRMYAPETPLVSTTLH